MQADAELLCWCVAGVLLAGIGQDKASAGLEWDLSSRQARPRACLIRWLASQRRPADGRIYLAAFVPPGPIVNRTGATFWGLACADQILPR